MTMKIKNIKFVRYSYINTKKNAYFETLELEKKGRKSMI